MATPPQIDLAISQQPSFIEKNSFLECIPLHYVAQLSENPCLKDKWDLTNYSHKIASQSYMNEREQLKGYLKQYCKFLKSFKVGYKKPKHKWGRVFPCKSLGCTSFAKKTRNTLIKDFYLDFDLKNAQPEILRNICLANNIPCDTITKYCNEREEIIAEIIKASGNKVDRSLVKSLVIRLSFCGTFKNWVKDEGIEPFPEPVIIADYCAEVKIITEIIKKENSEMFNTISRLKKAKGDTNVNGAFLSTYLQEWELRLVENTLSKICYTTDICKVELKTDLITFYDAIYEFDGLKLNKTKIEKYGGVDKVLELMNNLNLEMGFDVKWEIKEIEKYYDIEFTTPPHEETTEEKKERLNKERQEKKLQRENENMFIKECKEEEKERKKKIKQLEKEQKDKEYQIEREAIIDENSDILASNDIEAAEIIYEKIKDNIKYSNKTLYYKTNYMWYSDEGMINSLLSVYISKSGIKRLNDGNELIDYVQNRKNSQNVLKLVIDLSVQNADNDWSRDMNASSLGYILFTNGYYNFKESIFIPFDSSLYDHKIVFLEQIPYPFEMCDDKEYLKSVKQRMFIDPFGEEVADYYILNIARGLAGDAMKRCLFGIGDGNTGKSAMTSAIKSVAGGYFGTFNANNLVVKKIANPDDAQALRWVMLLANKRIIASNELEPDVWINGSILKKLSSGGKDDIVARKHGGYETEYKISFLPIIFANDLDKITPMDDAIVNRVRAIPYNKTYLDNPTNDNYELKIDPNFDDEIQTPKFRSAFMLLLMKAYKKFMKNERVEYEPQEIKKAFVDTFGKVEEYVDTFKNDFVFTDNENDYVESALMIEWIKAQKLNISINKLTRDIKKYCEKNKLTNIHSKLKKISGKPKQVWIGIKSIDDDDDIPDDY
jgi:phage/plasmid-associated DNA primase